MVDDLVVHVTFGEASLWLFEDDVVSARSRSRSPSMARLIDASDVVENRTVRPDEREVIRKLPGKPKWPNLVLERGLDPFDKLWPSAAGRRRQGD